MKYRFKRLAIFLVETLSVFPVRRQAPLPWRAFVKRELKRTAVESAALVCAIVILALLLTAAIVIPVWLGDGVPMWGQRLVAPR